MDVSQVTEALRDAVGICIEISGPILLLGMFVGVLMAIVQAVTQIHEQSVSFVFKLIVVIVYLIFAGSWMLRTLQEFTVGLMNQLV